MIRFILNDHLVETGEQTGMTLLDFIRYNKGLTGTKIGCREGDCGACTVLVGSIEGDVLKYRSITSCISPLQNADGKHIVTVEGTNLEEGLNQAQQAMKDNFATQCGFCTPGFVMGLMSFVVSDCSKDETNAIQKISGNICRCTGYKSIERAAAQLAESIEGENNRIEDLVEEKHLPEYFKSIKSRLAKLQRPEVAVNSVGRVVGGGTDLYVQRADDMLTSTNTYVFERQQLRQIALENGVFHIGASATVTDLKENASIRAHFVGIDDHIKLVSSEQIRNMATLGGNIVNASPIADMVIMLLALDSKLKLEQVNGEERQVELKQFYKGYKTYDLGTGEFINTISFEAPKEGELFNFEKVCKRTHLDIASVNSAIKIQVENDQIMRANISVGGVAPIPKYLEKTSAFLVGKKIDKETIHAGAELMQSEIAPISDVRGSKSYKRLLARQLYFAHFHKLFPDQFNTADLRAFEKQSDHD